MRALDFSPGDRLAAAKQVARRFIEGRPGDRIGLVVFASESYTQCPLTSDHGVLLSLLEEIELDFVRQALDRAGGSVPKAAKLIGLTTKTLEARMQRFGL